VEVLPPGMPIVLLELQSLRKLNAALGSKVVSLEGLLQEQGRMLQGILEACDDLRGKRQAAQERRDAKNALKVTAVSNENALDFPDNDSAGSGADGFAPPGKIGSGANNEPTGPLSDKSKTSNAKTDVPSPPPAGDEISLSRKVHRKSAIGATASAGSKASKSSVKGPNGASERELSPMSALSDAPDSPSVSASDKKPKPKPPARTTKAAKASKAPPAKSKPASRKRKAGEESADENDDGFVNIEDDSAVPPPVKKTRANTRSTVKKVTKSKSPA